jgi:hypothetical protein
MSSGASPLSMSTTSRDAARPAGAGRGIGLGVATDAPSRPSKGHSVYTEWFRVTGIDLGRSIGSGGGFQLGLTSPPTKLVLRAWFRVIGEKTRRAASPIAPAAF